MLVHCVLNNWMEGRMRKERLMIVWQLICHKAVGVLWCIVSRKGKAELHSRHRGKRQKSLVLRSKGVVETVLKQSGWGSRGTAVEWNWRHEALLMILYLPLQFHSPILKPGLDLSSKKNGVGDGRDKSETLLKNKVQTMNNCISDAFPILYHLD